MSFTLLFKFYTWLCPYGFEKVVSFPSAAHHLLLIKHRFTAYESPHSAVTLIFMLLEEPHSRSFITKVHFFNLF